MLHFKSAEVVNKCDDIQCLNARKSRGLFLYIFLRRFDGKSQLLFLLSELPLVGLEVTSFCRECVLLSSRLARQKLRQHGAWRRGFIGTHTQALFHLQNNPCSVAVIFMAPRSSCICFDAPAERLPVKDSARITTRLANCINKIPWLFQAFN